MNYHIMNMITGFWSFIAVAEYSFAIGGLIFAIFTFMIPIIAIFLPIFMLIKGGGFGLIILVYGGVLVSHLISYIGMLLKDYKK